VRGPDLLWGGDVHRFHPPQRKFDGVIGGPPCQIFSRLKRLNPLAGEKHGNQIPEFERVVHEATPWWFLMENVPEAPEPSVSGYAVRSYLLRDAWVGGRTSRMRRFSFGSLYGLALNIEVQALWDYQQPEPAVCASDGGRAVPVKIGGSGKPKRVGAALLTDRSRRTFADACELQGLPRDFLSDSPFTHEGKRKAIGNGVPLPMGVAIARAVRHALQLQQATSVTPDERRPREQEDGRERALCARGQSVKIRPAGSTASENGR
jgi:DNA (cytosine-5)-methyltransferase 1